MTEPSPAVAPAAPLSVTELIDQLERAVFQRRTSDGVRLLLDLLQAMSIATQRAPLGLMPPPGTSEQRRAVYTRVAAMISALVCSPDFVIDLRQITHLCGRKPILEAIFELSGYEGPFHLLAYHGARNADGGFTLRANQVFVLSLFYSLDDLPQQLLEGVLQLPPDQLLPLMLGWFTAPFVHSEAGERNRRALIEGSKQLATATPTAEVLQAISSAWMHCSYADFEHKHEFKQNINTIWTRLAGMAGIKGRTRERRIVDKPRLLLAAERMMNGHAMHRCYGPCLAQLRQKFEVICMVSAPFYSTDLANLFDKVEIIESAVDLRELAGRVVRLEPDLIFYPSLGMSEWTQAFCNLRFAPIQMMTVGHPAPAMSDCIDYSIVHAGVGPVAGEFGRKVIERKIWGKFERHPDVEAFQLTGEKFDDGRVHIAVNSSLMKLSPRFLALCERIEAEARRPVHFHFFASAMGVSHDRIRQIFERRFRYFTLEPSRRYGEFLKVLERCHLALAAFPFGNTNSTVDTCLVQVPSVAFQGEEVLSIFDRDVLRMAGLPEWLACKSDKDYFDTAMKLIHDEDARAAIVAQLAKGELRQRLFEWDNEADATEFVDAIDWIYRNHEALQASSAHLIKVGEPIPT